MTMAKRTELNPVLEHTWPTTEWVMARLMVRLEKIVANKGLTLQTWTEDGLGRATGCACRLPSGVVILLRELEHLISHFKAKGPDVFVDAADLQEIGAESILSETLLMLGLDASDVEFEHRAPTELEVADIRRVVDEIRCKQGSEPGLR